MSAPAPARSTGTFSISFGLLNVPVSIYTATEEVRVKRSEYTKDGAKVGNEKRVKNEDGSYGAPVERGEIIKKYETSRGLVDLTDDEIDALGTVVPGVADMVAVLPFGVLSQGTYTPNGQVWQVRASKLGSGRAAKANPGGEKAYALLLAALKAEASFALVRFARGGSVYHAALLPTGRLVGLYCDDEVRADRELPTPDISDAELALARQLVQSAKVTKPVALVNELVERVADYAEAKATGTLPEAAAAVDNTPAMFDLMAQLQASVDAAKVSA